jgi:hypothetical protein
MADYHIVLIEQGKQSYGFEKKGSKESFCPLREQINVIIIFCIGFNIL